MAGRPMKYTPGLASLIADELGQGKTLLDICADKDMPSRTSVYRWLEKVPEFRDMYARARERQCDTLAEEALATARNATNEDANAVRVRLDAIKWFTAKVAPKTYGDSATLKHAGADGGPLTVQVVRFGDDPPSE